MHPSCICILIFLPNNYLLWPPNGEMKRQSCHHEVTTSHLFLTTCSSESAWLITLSFLSAHMVTNRNRLATVRLWARRSSCSFFFFSFLQSMVWANAHSWGRLFKSFRMALGFIWEQEITGLCMLNHLVRRKLRKSLNNECLSYMSSCLVNWASCICIYTGQT